MVLAYQGFAALRNAIEEFPPAGRIFTKPKIDKKTVMDAEYVAIPSREVDGYTDEKGGRIPNLLAGKGYYEWLAVCRTFASKLMNGAGRMHAT